MFTFEFQRDAGMNQGAIKVCPFHAAQAETLRESSYSVQDLFASHTHPTRTRLSSGLQSWNLTGQ